MKSTMKFNYFRRAAMMLLVMMTVASAAAQDITQCTVTGLPDYVLHLNPDEMNEVFDNIVVKIGDATLTKGTDYTVKIEQKNGQRYEYNGSNSYDVEGMMYLNDEVDPVEGFKKPYWQHGDVYDEKFVVIGAGSYAGQEKTFAYKRFFLEWDYDWTHTTSKERFMVRTVADLNHIAAAINSGLNMSYYHYVHGFILANDIEFDSNTINNFTPIGTAEHPFNTTFACSGMVYWSCHVSSQEYNTGAKQPIGFAYRTISGIRRTTADAPIGLFGCLGSGAVVSDVTLSNCQFTVSGTGVAGSIAGTVQSGATVERCLVKGGYIEGTTAGAIVGSNSGTLSRNYYTGSYVAIGGTAYPSNVGTAAGDVDGARRDVGLTVPGSLSLDDGTASGLVFDGSFYGGAGETLTFYEDTFDAYTTTGPVASFTHDAANYKYELAINNDAADAIAINHANHFGTDAGADGSEEHPYIITTTAGLDFLAELVNGDPNMDSNSISDFYDSRYKFKDKFFKLGGDIAYNPAALTFDLDNDGTEDSNYKPIAIGQTDQYGYLQGGDGLFLGTFDGDGHTISGIRINNPNGVGLGIFGCFGCTANNGNGNQYVGLLKNLTVSNTNIIGHFALGGIVASFGGLAITNCHVTNTVSIQANGHEDFEGERAGGIVGVMNGGIVSYGPEVNTISYCTSGVTIIAENNDYSGGFGGIVGYMNPIRCTLSHNIVDGATLSGKEGNGLGAVLGSCLSNYVRDYSFDHNYYHNCTINGETNATGRGYSTTSASAHYVYSYAADITENDGIVPGFALFDDCDNRPAIALAATAGGSIDVKLVGRTLYKDGAWNTLCLPFAVSNITGSPLEGATVKTLLPSSSLANDGTLTLTFSEPLTAIEAGKPYIVKWDKALDYEGNESTYDISNPVFSAVTIAAAAPTAVSFTNNANNGGDCQFVGQYAPFTIGDTSTGTYDGDLNEILLLAAGNKIGYSQNARTLRPQRCHFYVPTGTAGARAVNDFVLDFGHDESTRIISTTDYTDSTDSAGWFTLDGRKLAAEPAQKGIYIHNGHKVVIK